METAQDTSEELVPKMVPLPELRAAYVLREQARITRMLRRERLNAWAAGLVVVLLVGIGAGMFLAARPSFDGSAGRVDVRHPR
jgi:hypothetical protein